MQKRSLWFVILFVLVLSVSSLSTGSVYAEEAGGTFGLNESLRWSIDDKGHFILEPFDGSVGTINYTYASATEQGGTTPRAGSRLWPWEDKKKQIITAEIKGEVRTYGLDLPGMFEYCDNLVEADVSGLNVSRVGSVSYFFANSPKLKTIKGLDKWADSVNQNTAEKTGTGAIKNVASMFRNCASLEELDLSTWTSDGVMKNFQNMCNGCRSLKTFKLNNEGFKTAEGAQWQTAHHVGNGVFYGCSSLETVDMSGITIKANADGFKGLEELFAGLPALKEVTMKGIDLNLTTDLSDMFNNCQNLERLTFSPKSPFERSRDMEGFFANCSKLAYLDITGLDNRYSTSNGLGFEDLESLKMLIADYSNVRLEKEGHQNTRRLEDVVLIRDIDFISDGDFDFTPKGPGYEADTISTDVNGIIQLAIHDETADDANPFYVLQKTHGVGNPNDAGRLAPGTYVRTSEIVPSDIEIPPTFYLVDSMENKCPTIEFYVNGKWQLWDYSNRKDDFEGSGYMLTSTASSGSFSTRIFTLPLTNKEWKKSPNYDRETDRYTYSQGSPIRITYPDAATSVNGNKHDVIITIPANGITFENMSRIPNTNDETYINYDENFEPEVIDNPWGPQSVRPDKKKIPGYKATTSRRYLINADIGELRFWNQVIEPNPSTTSVTDAFLYSKGSGTNIQFSIAVEGASENQSVLYWCDDLDMPENESWTMHETDPDKDVRNAVNYAPGAEGIVLGEGNDLETIALSPKTLLKVYNYASGEVMKDITTPGVGNYIIGSKPDPETVRSRFYVKASAVKADYLWTTGTSCETTVLKSTSFKRPDQMNIHLEPQAAKTINSRTPSSDDPTFKFILEPASDIQTVDVDGEQISNKAGTAYPGKVETFNNLGEVEFEKITITAPGQNFIDTGKLDPIYDSFKVLMDSDNRNFFCDKAGVCWSWNVIEGQEEEDPATLELIKYKPCIDLIKAYVFKITEEEGSQPGITGWDKTEYYIKIISRAPASDADIDKGSSAEITIGSKAPGAAGITWGQPVIKYGSDTKTAPYQFSAGTFDNKKFALSGEKTWDDAAAPAGTRPDSVTILIHADNDVVKEVEVKPDAAGKWEWYVDDLPEYQADNPEVPIRYSVTEKEDAGLRGIYTPTVSGYNIKNTYVPSEISVTVEKVWMDDNNRDGIRPASVTVNLLADGVKVDSRVLTEGNEWKHEFTELPEYKTDRSGNEIRYTVEEERTEVLTGTDGRGTYAIRAEEISEDEWKITNTHTPEKINISGRKTWDDGENREGQRPGSIKIVLLADNEEYAHKTVTADNWSWTFTDMPKYKNGKEIKYTIHELDDEGINGKYTPFYSGYDVTNTYTPNMIFVEAEVIWRDHEDRDGIRPGSVTIYLIADGDEANPVASAVLSEENGWRYEFTNLPEYNADGREIVYTVKEARTDVLTGTDGKETYAIEEKEVHKNNWLITNIHTPAERITLEVFKQWDDSENADGKRPGSVTVELLAGGEPDGRTLTLSEDSGWQGKFTDLPASADYSVRELNIPQDYTVSYGPVTNNTVTVTNTYERQDPFVPWVFIRLDEELPRTGLTKAPVLPKPLSVNYRPLAMELLIPSLNVVSEIVSVDHTGEGYPVEWLGMNAGLLADTAMPGEGYSVIAAHNTLNAEEFGPFALLSRLEMADRVFIRINHKDLMAFEVYASEKIDAADSRALARIASQHENSLTLLTCEDEIPEGGYASRRIVALMPVGGSK